MKRIKYSNLNACLGLVLLLTILISKLANIFYDLIPGFVSLYLTLFGGILGVFFLLKAPVRRCQFFKISKQSALSLILFLVISISVILQNLVLTDATDDIGRSAHRTTFLIYIVSCAHFLLGAYLCNLKIKENNLVALLLVGFLAAGIYHNLDGGLVLNYRLLSSKNSEGVDIDHLVIGEVTALCIILAIAFAGSKMKLLIYLIGILIFFSLGGRTALFCFILTVLLYIFIKQKIKYVFSLLMAIVVASLAFMLYLGQKIDDPLVSRMLLSSGLSEDQSKIERDELFFDALPSLLQQAPIGDPTLIIKQFSSLGAYSHNLLSAWQFYGLISFIMILIIIFYIGLFIRKNKEKLVSKSDDFGLILFIYCVLSVITGKAITFSIFWLVLGFWLYRIKFLKKDKKIIYE